MKINYSRKKKKYQIWEEGEIKELLKEIIIRNAREIKEIWKKELSKERTEHLYLTGEIEREIDYGKIKIKNQKRLVYYPSKHKGFMVEDKGKSLISLEEITKEGKVDLLCRIVNYHAEIQILDNEESVRDNREKEGTWKKEKKQE